MGRDRPCMSSGCVSQAWAKQLCKAHYRRLTGELSTPVKHYARNKGHYCKLVCDRPAHVSGLCKRHYRRMQEGREDWAAPLVARAANHSLPFGRVRVKRQYAHLFQQMAKDMGLALNALATLLLEEYARARLHGKVEDGQLTVETWSRKE